MTTTKTIREEIERELWIFRGWTTEQYAVENLDAAVDSILEQLNKYCMDVRKKAFEEGYEVATKGFTMAMKLDDKNTVRQQRNKLQEREES